MRRHPTRLATVFAGLALLAAACGSDSDGRTGDAAQDGEEALTGVIHIVAGECADGGVTSGSWFRMVQSGGTVADGPFVENGDSPCGDTTWAPLLPGADGGVALGEHQPFPDPAFDGQGNGLADAIVEPVTWFSVKFSAATPNADPQTGATAPAPSLLVKDGELSGDFSAFAAAWNGQHFNQGAPKPDGSVEANTAVPHGTYDEATGRVTVEWASQIAGGAFDGFTGVWHLEGTLAS